MSEQKPTVLVLGGCGFIGRHMVKYLVDQKVASKIVVADKATPVTSYFSEAIKTAFAQKDIVEFKQADLSKDDHVERIFKIANFTYVINLCGETRFGLSEEDYKIKCFNTAQKCGAAALKAGVKKFVEVSTAQVYVPDKGAKAEDGKIKPWTVQASYRLKAEEALRELKELPLVVIRPAIVYGPGDLTGLAPRIVSGAVYKQLKEKMKFLWGEELRLNVVHVADVVAALWLAATELKAGSVYNLADSTDLTQGTLNGYLGEIFEIKTGFVNNILSNLAKMNLASIADEANDKHVPVWSKLCQDHKINTTPLSPYLDKELLYNTHTHINGSKITKDSAFQYKHQFSKASVLEFIEEAMAQQLFPPVVTIKK